MQFKLLTTLALAAAAIAAPAGGGQTCSTGDVQCCNSVQKAGDPAVAQLLTGLGIVVQDVNVPIGVTCNPISVIGVGTGNACSANAVCCDNNNTVSVFLSPATLR